MDGLDVVVGGHTNTFLWNGPRPDYVKQTPMGSYPTVVTQRSGGKRVLVVQTNGYGRYLGKLEVTFNGNGEATTWSGNPVLLNNSYAQDPTIASSVTAYRYFWIIKCNHDQCHPEIVCLFRNLVAAKMDTVVGHTQDFIDGGRPKCRLEECSFGNFVTDAMAAEMGVKMALINSGAIKGSFRKGKEEVMHLFPAKKKPRV